MARTETVPIHQLKVGAPQINSTVRDSKSIEDVYIMKILIVLFTLAVVLSTSSASPARPERRKLDDCDCVRAFLIFTVELTNVLFAFIQVHQQCPHLLVHQIHSAAGKLSQRIAQVLVTMTNAQEVRNAVTLHAPTNARIQCTWILLEFQSSLDFSTKSHLINEIL